MKSCAHLRAILFLLVLCASLVSLLGWRLGFLGTPKEVISPEEMQKRYTDSFKVA